MIRVGVIVNPIAGMGGRVGLKGTDGVVIEARRRGALPRASIRAAEAIAQMVDQKDKCQFLAAAGEMGETILRESGLLPLVVYTPTTVTTEAEDTVRCVKKMIREQVELILFAGGDGTARDICRAIGESVPVIGIPAGVKIHSPVYAQTPQRAGELARLFVKGEVPRVAPAEVLDIDEDSYRHGSVHTRLFGYLLAPVERTKMQNQKAGSALSEHGAQNTIALDIIDRMETDIFYLIGPGSTTRPILDNLGLTGSLLGVDVVCNQKIVALDVTEKQIIELTAGHNYKIIITPIGGQGYLFGRGNQQLSPKIINLTGKDNILVVATMEKITRLQGEPLLVDTGDEDTNRTLTGYIRVITGYGKELIYQVK